MTALSEARAREVEDLTYLITAHRFSVQGIPGAIGEPDLALARPLAAFLIGEGYQPPSAPVEGDEREALIESATWALIENDTDTVDRGVSDEHYRERRADVERVAPILANLRRPATPTEEDVEQLRDAYDEVMEKLAFLQRGCQNVDAEELRRRISAVGAAEWKRGFYWNRLVREERDGAVRAQSALRRAEDVLRDFAGHGLRFDLNPTMQLTTATDVYAQWAAYAQRMDESVRTQARAALSAVHPEVTGEDRAEIVVLCGSTRFKDAWYSEGKRLTYEGRIVLSVGDLDPSESARTLNVAIDDDLKEMLDALHMQKIRLADRVHVLNVGGYYGESTAREIAYARSLGKPVTFMEKRDPMSAIDKPVDTSLERVKKEPDSSHVSLSAVHPEVTQ